MLETAQWPLEPFLESKNSLEVAEPSERMTITNALSTNESSKAWLWFVSHSPKVEARQRSSIEVFLQIFVGRKPQLTGQVFDDLQPSASPRCLEGMMD